MASDISNCIIIKLDKIENSSFNIITVQNSSEFPFLVRRVYYLYDLPIGAERGGHAHKNLSQLIIAISGSFDILLDDGRNKKTIRLSKPDHGLLIVPGIWRELLNFSSGAICLVMASHKYDESDYLREYSSFLNFKNEKKIS
jgi:hypothetical protein